MKTRYIITASIAIAATVFANSCKDNKCDDPPFIPLKQLDKYIVYKATDVLKFSHNSSDTQTFVASALRKFSVITHYEDECSEEHECASIELINWATDNVIKIEYLYSRGDFSFAQYAPDPYTYLRFWYRKRNFNPSSMGVKDFFINGVNYGPLNYFTEKGEDTSSYIAYSFSSDTAKRGIVKIKFPGDTLTRSL